MLYHLVCSPRKKGTHAEQIEAFYRRQAGAYDAFRKRLLPGREELYKSLNRYAPKGTWVDMGGGTGANLEGLGKRINQYQKIYLVDLSPSLLSIARERIARNNWKNVEVVEADATGFEPFLECADVVTLSYALTMIPDWASAVCQAKKLLKPGGYLGIVDFYVSHRDPAEDDKVHNFLTRFFWPTWFSWDGVHLSGDHLPFLRRHFSTKVKKEARHRPPYIPFGKVPYYLFIGQK